jgi:hypothetical protein
MFLLLFIKIEIIGQVKPASQQYNAVELLINIIKKASLTTKHIRLFSRWTSSKEGFLSNSLEIIFQNIRINLTSTK